MTGPDWPAALTAIQRAALADLGHRLYPIVPAERWGYDTGGPMDEHTERLRAKRIADTDAALGGYVLISPQDAQRARDLTPPGARDEMIWPENRIPPPPCRDRATDRVAAELIGNTGREQLICQACGHRPHHHNGCDMCDALHRIERLEVFTRLRMTHAERFPDGGPS